LIAKITSDAPIYKIAIIGTNTPATLLIRFKPPKTISPVKITSTTPVTQPLIWKLLLATSATVLDCTLFPIPSAATAPKKAKATANHLNLGPSPRSIYYSGPLEYSPCAFLTRYFCASKASAYFVATPSKPTSHIQNIAPGPPKVMAVAT